jgi:predicted nuclease of predicted toxin-antitoxin system
MRYLLDEDVHPRVAEIARASGLDVVSVHEIDRRGYTDPEQLAFAASQERVFVTRNRDDFIRLTVAAFHSGAPHGGVLVAPRSLPNHQPERLAAALGRWHEHWAHVGSSMAYLLDSLP